MAEFNSPNQGTFVGQSLAGDRYVIETRVAVGGMGEVYRGRDRKLNQPVALKCVLGETRSRLHRQATREARTLADLDHPNIMRIHDLVTQGDTIWIIGEWLDGDNLAAFKGGAGPLTAMAILHQILEALAYTHAAGIIHRDIKPANFIMTKEGLVKLIDFGVAFHPAQSSGETIAGSRRYIDPRVLAGKQADWKSDLYGAALVILEIIHKNPVWPGKDPLSLYRRIKKTLGSRVIELTDGLYPPLAGLLGSFMLQVHPNTEKPATEMDARRATEFISGEFARLTDCSPRDYLATRLAAGRIDDFYDPMIKNKVTAITKAMVADQTTAAGTKTMWLAFAAAANLEGIHTPDQ